MHRSLPLFVLMLLTHQACFSQILKEFGIPGLEADSRFGQAVEILGRKAFVSAPTRQVNGHLQQGSVYIFEKESDWAPTHTLFAPEGRPYDKFGYSISAHGNMIAVGAPGKSSGAVYIFNDEGDQWTLQQILYPHIPGDRFFNSMLFGSSVKMTEEYLFVSAPEYLKSASEVQASVFVFRREANEWVFAQRLSHPDDQPSTLFGHSIDATPAMLLIGAPKADGGAGRSGAAFLYERSNDEWSLTFTFIDDQSYPNEHFGSSVSIDAERVIIGSPMHVFEESEGPVGTAHVFIRTGTVWFHTEALKSAMAQRNEQFGERVAIRGDYALVAAGRTTHSAQTNAGSVHVFRLENGFWNEKYQLTPDSGDVQSHMYFGSAFAFAGEEVLIGAHLEDNHMDDSGNAYIHQIETTVSTYRNDPGNASFTISPNPFKEETTLWFDLPVASAVKIEAYDGNGTLVELIAENHYTSGRHHAVAWTPKKLLPGIYFIRFQTEWNVAVAKVSFIQ